MNKSELLNAIVDSCEFKEWLEYQLTYDDFLYSVAYNCFHCSGFNSDIIDYLECELDSEQAYDDALDVVDDILREFSITDLQHFLNELHDEYHLSALNSTDGDHYDDACYYFDNVYTKIYDELV